MYLYTTQMLTRKHKPNQIQETQIKGETPETPGSTMYVEGMNLSKGTLGQRGFCPFFWWISQHMSCGYQKEKLRCG